jgi:hypothetical protein
MLCSPRRALRHARARRKWLSDVACSGRGSQSFHVIYLALMKAVMNESLGEPAARPGSAGNARRPEPQSSWRRTSPFGETADVHPELDGPVVCKAGLQIKFAAIGVCWDDATVPLSLAEARILSHVLLYGGASWSEMNRVLGGRPRTCGTLRVMTYRIRNKLRDAGAPNPLQTVAGWGLRLRAAGQGALRLPDLKPARPSASPRRR